MAQTQPISALFRGSLLFGVFAVGLWLEHRRPLRKVTQPKMKRVAINLGLAATAMIALRLVFFPIVYQISQHTTEMRWGILPVLALPSLFNLIVAILALDYTLYIWHWMNHRIPFFWRFHNAHHVDLDVDVSTASRFHFGELIFSTGFRSCQIVLLGIDPFTLILFEIAITTAAQFHHSNIRLPFRFEKYLVKLMVTPRMHGIHHSIVRGETDSNYSTIFSFWDRLHRSIQLNIPQSKIIIGVASYRDSREIGFIQTLLLPFRQHRVWKLPDGTVPERECEEITAQTPGQLVA